MLRVSQRPAGYPVTLAEAKAQLRITDAAEDAMITGLIATATAHCENLVQRVFVPRTLRWVLPAWRDELEIPVAPVAADAVASVRYVDWTSETRQILDPSAYVVGTRGDSVVIFPRTSWPLTSRFASEPIVVEFSAGYRDLADLPANVRTAILLQIRHLHNIGQANPGFKASVIGVAAEEWQASADVRTLIPDVVRGLMLSEAW